MYWLWVNKVKPIPTPLTVNTGEQEMVQGTIDDFFDETTNFVRKNYEVHEFLFNFSPNYR
mgnify:FL=1